MTFTHEVTPNNDAPTAECKGFFSLPLELRMKIYKLLLLSPVGSSNSYHNNGYTIALHRNLRTTNRTGLDPAIVGTCKQIAVEADGILLRGNNVTFPGPDRMTAWLDTIGPRDTEMVRDISVSTSVVGFDMQALDTALQRCTNLRRVHIHASMMSCDPISRPVFCLGFLMQTKLMLDAHPTLSKSMSMWNGGYQHQLMEGGPQFSTQYRDDVCFTLAAGVEDSAPHIDGIVVDIDDAMQDLTLGLTGFGT